MRHDWIFDVLRDLRAYAQTNGLPALAHKADEALRVARAEIAAGPLADPLSEGGEGGDETPVQGRPH